MKVQVLCPRCVTYITYVTFDRGYYKINWATSQVEYFKNKLRNSDHFRKSMQYLLDIRDFEAIPGENAKRIPSCCKLDTLYDTYILEYIEGDVSLPLHFSDADEVYLSASAPFGGSFSYLSHKTFSGRLFVLKRIPK